MYHWDNKTIGEEESILPCWFKHDFRKQEKGLAWVMIVKRCSWSKVPAPDRGLRGLNFLPTSSKGRCPQAFSPAYPDVGQRGGWEEWGLKAASSWTSKYEPYSYYPYFYNMTMLCLSLQSHIYFSTPWIWVELMTCLINLAEGTLQIPCLDLKRLCMLLLSLRILPPHVNKPVKVC